LEGDSYLREQKMRYGELKKVLVTINDKMLSQVLKELEEQGVVSRKVYEVCHELNIVPPRMLNINKRRQKTIAYYASNE
jgi:hypothetical protein